MKKETPSMFPQTNKQINKKKNRVLATLPNTEQKQSTDEQAKTIIRNGI
jgi:hypothetical protein